MSRPFNEHSPQKPKSFKVGDHALHGDVIVEMIDDLPKDFSSMTKLKDGILALGEVSGHRHQLQNAAFDLRECPKTKIKFLRIVEPTALKHDEHSPIVLPPGHFKIGIQKEYSPYEKLSRQVID